MRSRRPAGRIAMVGGWLFGLLAGVPGCSGDVPPTGSRAVLGADHLEKQRLKLEEIRASLKTRPATRPVVRR